MNQLGMEVSTGGDFDHVQNKRAEKEVALYSVNSACSSEQKSIIYLFPVGALSQFYTQKAVRNHIFFK